MWIRAAVCSTVGTKRKVNQDNFFLNHTINQDKSSNVTKSEFASQKERLYAVFDGMGGEEFGEEAALLAAESFCEYSKKYSQLSDRFDEHIKVYSRKTNDKLCRLMESRMNARMGTTAAILCVSPDKKEAVSGNIGDSKVFLFRDGELRKISEDHNEAQNLVRLGVIDENEARSHAGKSILTQHLGIRPEELLIEPYISDRVILKDGDCFLLCSDGLTESLTDREIIGILQKHACVKKKARALIAMAHEKKCRDNVTALVVRVSSAFLG